MGRPIASIVKEGLREAIGLEAMGRPRGRRRRRRRRRRTGQEEHIQPLTVVRGQELATKTK